MLNLSAFDELDWAGFAGAETGANGESPLIGSVLVAHLGKVEETTVVVSGASGKACVQVLAEGYTLDLGLDTFALARFVAESFTETMSREKLESIGFRSL